MTNLPAKMSRTLARGVARGMAGACLALPIWAGEAWADPIEGDWFTPSKETVRIAPCGNSWCGTVVTGTYAGASIGVFTGSDGKYSAKIKEPKHGRSATGKAKLSGRILSIEGCMAGVVCAKRDWKKL